MLRGRGLYVQSCGDVCKKRCGSKHQVKKAWGDRYGFESREPANLPAARAHCSRQSETNNTDQQRHSRTIFCYPSDFKMLPLRGKRKQCFSVSCMASPGKSSPSAQWHGSADQKGTRHTAEVTQESPGKPNARRHASTTCPADGCAPAARCNG